MNSISKCDSNHKGIRASANRRICSELDLSPTHRVQSPLAKFQSCLSSLIFRGEGIRARWNAPRRRWRPRSEQARPGQERRKKTRHDKTSTNSTTACAPLAIFLDSHVASFSFVVAHFYGCNHGYQGRAVSFPSFHAAHQQRRKE